MVLPFLLPVAAAQSSPPPVPREFRAVWVATVANIDWPTKRTGTSASQKAELVRIMDLAVSLHLNTIIFQVRPAADAFYNSRLEPWSQYLTGVQGQRPTPFYDPLEFAVQEAHRRGLQIHAWFNPYRAQLLDSKGTLASNHIARTHPELVKKYGSFLWMDPGEPRVQERSLAVISDVVRRYDIDGVHLDDYFYPYPEGGKDFPDSGSYAKYGRGLSRTEWRHRNVDSFIASLNDRIHRIKPWVQFGISPFGIYRSGIPAGIKAGIDQYTELYSDPVKWMQQGWCDYLSPQLYWPIAQREQSFPVLLNWWRSQNSLGRHVYPGLYTSRVMTSKKGYSPQEVVQQVLLSRRGTEDPGHIHFSMQAFTKDSKSINEYLSGSCYKGVALMPASPWLNPAVPGAPSVSMGQRGDLSWSANGDFAYTVVQERFGGSWLTEVVPATQNRIQVPLSLPSGGLNKVEVAMVSRTGVLGEYAEQDVSR